MPLVEDRVHASASLHEAISVGEVAIYHAAPAGVAAQDAPELYGRPDGSGGGATGVTLAPLVSALIDAFIHGLHQRLPAAGFSDIRPAQCTGVFRVIDPHGTRPTELARRTGVTPQAMAEFVSYLEQRG
jgi:hypothetical protein